MLIIKIYGFVCLFVCFFERGKFLCFLSIPCLDDISAKYHTKFIGDGPMA